MPADQAGLPTGRPLVFVQDGMFIFDFLEKAFDSSSISKHRLEWDDVRVPDLRTKVRRKQCLRNSDF